MQCVWNCQRVILNWFYNYGYFLGKHPYFFLFFPLLVCGCLAVGFKYLDPVDDLEYLYAPSSSRAIDDRDTVRKTFPDMSDDNFNQFNLNELIQESQIIFRSKKYKAILTDEVLDELGSFYNQVLAISVIKDGQNITLENVCKKRNGNCVIFGAFVFDTSFKGLLKAGNVTYPVWVNQPGVDMTSIFSKVNFNFTTGALISVGSFKISIPVKSGAWSKAWEHEFVKLAQETKFTTVDIAYSSSFSMGEELDKGTKGDILYFSLTFTLMITYASIVSSGGDCVSSRALLANAGVVAVLFGILGAFGLVTLCGVNFVSIVGTMPFLTLGIGVDDMFLLMSSWSETLSVPDLTIPERIGTVYRKAGIGITITSVTDFLAFGIGASSSFRSVRNFCIYTGVGVILCYICNACVFGACLTFHARRVYSQRHVFTCQKVEKSREQLKKDGQTCCRIFWCGGKVPSKPDDDQSIFEQGPRKFLIRFLLWNPVRYMTLLFFAGYLAVSIWGCTKLRQGLELKNLAPKRSYFYEFQTWDDEDFGIKLPISFVTTTTKNYMDNQTLEDITEVIAAAQKDPLIVSEVSICWLMELARTTYYNTTSEDAFFTGLHEFLRQQPQFINDLVFGSDNRTITASRCHVYSYKVIDSPAQAELMVHMREVADASPADVFAYHPAFVLFEQYVMVFSSTLQTVGVTIAVMFVATCIFLPHPLMVILVIAQVFMIVIGIFGFMALWDLTLSSVTMIELIMSVGFSVDFCAHVCTAYMVSEERTRMDRARDSIIHASSPIFNGGVSSLIGVFMLLFTESYIFQSFFKIMLLVIFFGVIHAVFLIPVILSFIGPSAHINLDGRISPSPSHIGETSKRNIDASSLNKENTVYSESKDGIEIKSINIQNGHKLASSNGAFNDNDEIKDGINGNDLTPVIVKADDELAADSSQNFSDNGAIKYGADGSTIISINVKSDNKLAKTDENCSDDASSLNIKPDDKLANSDEEWFADFPTTIRL